MPGFRDIRFYVKWKELQLQVAIVCSLILWPTTRYTPPFVPQTQTEVRHDMKWLLRKCKRIDSMSNHVMELRV